MDLFGHHSTPALTLTDSRASVAQPTWDIAASFSRAKAYLVQAEDSLYSAANGLSATCILDVVPPAPGEHLASCVVFGCISLLQSAVECKLTRFNALTE